MRRRWAWFGLFTLLGLAGFGYRLLDDLARGSTGTAETRFLEEMTGAYTAAVMLPIVSFLVARVPWGETPWPRLVAAHLAGATLYSALHTTLMNLTRLHGRTRLQNTSLRPSKKAYAGIF